MISTKKPRYHRPCSGQSTPGKVNRPDSPNLRTVLEFWDCSSCEKLASTAFPSYIWVDLAEITSVVPEVEMSDDASILNDDTVIPGLHGTGRQPALTGCPWHDVNEMLQAAGLRPTRQRMALGWLLFGKGARHLTAEMLYEEATLAKVPVSLATVYNTLNQLTDAGLLRQVSVDGTKTYFDTNVSAHHHFYLENNHELVDIPDPHLVLNKMPEVPEGYEIARVDMVVRLRKKR
jgi:Fur family transcriptional regulator, iron response regulator